MWKDTMWVSVNVCENVFKSGLDRNAMHDWVCRRRPPGFVFAPEPSGEVAVNKPSLFIFFSPLDFIETTI